MLPALLQLITVIILLCCLQSSAHAAEWQQLSGTFRHKVAYDEQSIRLSPKGHLEVWLRFIPKGEPERRSAATEYKEKRYRSHMEFYEIDCSEQTARLGAVDILGTSQTRLRRIPGESSPEPMLPGSVLELLAKTVCPAIDEESKAVDAEDPEQPDNSNTEEEIQNGNKLKQISNLLAKTTTNDANGDIWKELGNLYFDTDQPEQAIRAYDHALALHPDDTDILNDQGAMYRQTGDFEHALANFEKAFSIAPDNLESLYNSAYVYAFDLNNIPKALTLWRRYLELDSKNETAHQIQSFIDQFGK